jgi:hypothetical protein
LGVKTNMLPLSLLKSAVARQHAIDSNQCRA